MGCDRRAAAILVQNFERYNLFLIVQLAIQFGVNCSAVNQSDAGIYRSSIIITGIAPIHI